MSEDNRRSDAPVAETAESPELQGDADQTKDGVSASQTAIDALVKERDDLQNQHLRAVAEFDNVRKRMRSEHAQRMQFANEQLIIELLPVLDNLERALESHPGSDMESLRSGIELTSRMFSDVLSRFGVTPITAVGQIFDPARHEAVSQEAASDAEEGTILEELQRGYLLHDRVIRPSRVKVATGHK